MTKVPISTLPISPCKLVSKNVEPISLLTLEIDHRVSKLAVMEIKRLSHKYAGFFIVTNLDGSKQKINSKYIAFIEDKKLVTMELDTIDHPNFKGVITEQYIIGENEEPTYVDAFDIQTTAELYKSNKFSQGIIKKEIK